MPLSVYLNLLEKKEFKYNNYKYEISDNKNYIIKTPCKWGTTNDPYAPPICQ